MFYESLINVFRRLGDKEIVVMVGDLNSHVENNPEDFEDQHGDYDYGASKKKKVKHS